MFTSERIVTLARAKELLNGMLSESEKTITSIGNEFQQLAREVDVLLSMAGATLDSIEEEGVTAIPSKVEGLITASDRFIHQRFETTAAILDVVRNEQKLLVRLSHLNAGNRSIARETRILGLLTSIEAARLGDSGSKFQYLAGQLRSFAETVAQSSTELDGHANGRRSAIQESQRRLAAALPRIRSEFERTQMTFEQALLDVRLSVEELCACPARFHGCVESVASEVAGVVSAIQSHDITRQQTEHVGAALESLSQAFQRDGPALELPKVAVGLTIQILQMKNIQVAIKAWATQIGTCLSSILGVSSSELANIGPLVLRQEQGLSSQLVRIKDLEQECERDSEEVKSALSGLSKLMGMIADYLKKTRSIRDRMQLLSFNSIIEANNLGSEANVMLEISRNITRVSADWAEMTDQSETTMKEILGLVDQAKDGMRALGCGGEDGLKSAQVEIKEVLHNLKAAAEDSARGAMQIAVLTSNLHGKIESIREKARQLNGHVDAMGEALHQIENVRQEIEEENPGIEMQLNGRAEMEQEYSAAYTTEIERHVLHAALFGSPLPEMQAIAEGNDVELF